MDRTDKTDRHSQKITGIEALEEILGSLRITEDYVSDRSRIIEPALKEMSIVPIPAVYNKIVQAVMLKSIVSDPR